MCQAFYKMCSVFYTNWLVKYSAADCVLITSYYEYKQMFELSIKKHTQPFCLVYLIYCGYLYSISCFFKKAVAISLACWFHVKHFFSQNKLYLKLPSNILLSDMVSNVLVCIVDQNASHFQAKKWSTQPMESQRGCSKTTSSKAFQTCQVKISKR